MKSGGGGCGHGGAFGSAAGSGDAAGGAGGSEACGAGPASGSGPAPVLARAAAPATSAGSPKIGTRRSPILWKAITVAAFGSRLASGPAGPAAGGVPDIGAVYIDAGDGLAADDGGA
ncbi:MAG: hypothetical protein JNL82_16095 [Myxococcales bacterium]|nr:hypothetical protein [Myxococcales bacterium]